MNRSELENTVAHQAGLTARMARAAVDAVFAAIALKIAAGEEVRLLGFGIFELKQQAARTGRNPQTGAPMEIPEKQVVRFRPGADLKAAAEGTAKRAA